MKTLHAPSLEQSARLLKAYADPVRLRLLSLLEGREVCVCHLHEAVQLPQPTVSRHLAYLRRAGLVAARKEGLWVHYRLTEPSSPLHRALRESVSPNLVELATIQADRERLDRLASC
jgi:ArsR family transcriptional regulator